MKRLIGMVHLGALPGAPGNTADTSALERAALEELHALERAGFDAAIVENMGDEPFRVSGLELESFAAFVSILKIVVANSKIEIGLSIQMNLWKEMLAAGVATGASFVRIEAFSEERIAAEGRIGPVAADCLRYRKKLASNIRIAADVQVKHTFSVAGESTDRYFAQTADRFADYIIATGAQTGQALDCDYLRELKSFLKKPVWVGSGVSQANVRELLEVADGVIVGTSIKKDGSTTNPIDPLRASELVKAAK